VSDRQRGRIEEKIRQLVAELLIRKVKDPRVEFVSVTGVEVSRDYSVAKIMYNVVGGESEPGAVRDGLESCRGFLRGRIKKLMRMRTIPELVFEYDTSLDKAFKIERLIQKVHEEKESADEGEPGD